MYELIVDFLSAVRTGILPIWDLVYNSTIKHWVFGFGAITLGALFGYVGFWRRRSVSRRTAAAWAIVGIFFGGWLGGMVDGLYPVVKACGHMGLSACMDWAGVAPASVFGVIFMLATFAGGSNNKDSR